MSDSDDSLIEPDWTEPEFSVPDAPAPWRARGVRRAPVEPERGRGAVIAAVLATLVVVAVIAAIAGQPSPSPAPSTADAVPISPMGSYSSSAFCSAGTGTAATTTVYLTNGTPRAVTGVMTAVGPPAGGGVPTVRRGVTVPPLRTVAVNPGQGLPAGSNASTFVFSEAGWWPARP